jgi:hypothetical protein
VVLRGCTVSGTPATTHLAVGPGTPVQDLVVEECEFGDIGDGSTGVDLVAAVGARLSRSTFRAARDAPAAQAVRITGGSRAVLIEDNDLTGVPAATAITDLAPDTVIQGNRTA